MVVRGFCGNQAARTAQQVLAHRVVSAQECRRSWIGNAHALQQRFSGVTAAGLLRPVQREAWCFQSLEGKVFCQRFNRIAHQFGGQVRGIGAKRSHSKRPAATCQQHSGHCSGDALGVFLGGLGQAIKQSQAGGGQAVNQVLSPELVCQRLSRERMARRHVEALRWIQGKFRPVNPVPKRRPY